MPREYRHISQYEKEILELKDTGLTYREIGEKIGFTKTQVEEFCRRYRQKQRKLAAGIAIRKKGRPAKDSIVRG